MGVYGYVYSACARSVIKLTGTQQRGDHIIISTIPNVCGVSNINGSGRDETWHRNVYKLIKSAANSGHIMLATNLNDRLTITKKKKQTTNQ